ncbi:MAG: Ger(x)C family spore germination protein [Symbiobacteriia bacterium]
MALSLLLTGCWDLEEIENRGVVLAIGFDLTQDGKVEATIQLPRPQALNFARGQNPSTPGEQFIITSAQGETAWDALAHADQQTSRRLYLGHVQAVVIGEDLARRGFYGILDALMRHAKISRQARVLIAQKASGIIRQPVVGELLPAFYFAAFYESQSNTESSADVRLWRAWHDMTMPGGCYYIPRISVDQNQFKLEGIELIGHRQLVGQLDGKTARGFNWLRGAVKSGSIVVEVMGQPYTLHLVRNTRHVPEAGWGGGTPYITFNARVTAALADNEGTRDATDPEVWAGIERALAEEVKAEAEAAIRAMQQAGADSLDIGEYVRAADPVHWDPQKWLEIYPKTQVTIHVDATLRNTGDIQEAE